MDFLFQILDRGWVGSTIELVGIVAAVLLYRASLVKACPVYQRRALRLIGSDESALPPNIEIRFRNQVVERLTKTYIVFWNAGKVTLRGSDIVEDDPVRCEFAPDARVLEASVVKNSRPANKFSIVVDPKCPNCAVLSFDYLDTNDGATIEILHTDQQRYPALKGTVRGVPRGVLDRGRIAPARRRDLPRYVLRWMPYIMLATGLLSVCVGIFLPETKLTSLTTNDPAAAHSTRWPFIGVGGVYIALPAVYLWIARRRFPTKLHTPELDE